MNSRDVLLQLQCAAAIAGMGCKCWAQGSCVRVVRVISREGWWPPGKSSEVVYRYACPNHTPIFYISSG